MSTFTISPRSNLEHINISVPLNVSYIINEKYTVDNTNNTIYPNNAIVHQYIYSTLSKIDNLLKNTAEEPTYVSWDWNNWYSAGSLAYTYDSTTSYYKFYKALKMTNPLIPLTNTTYWNDFVSPVWNSGYTYLKGAIVHTFVDGVYAFYESLSNVPLNIELDNTTYWKVLVLGAWSYDVKYNIGTRVASGYTVYTCIKTAFPVTRIDNKEYWTPYFNYYALIKISDVSIEFKASLEALQAHVISLKQKFELDTSNMIEEEMSLLYDEMYALNLTIQNDWIFIQNTYNLMYKSISSRYGLIWKNMYDANIYFKELNLYTVDPMRVLDAIKYLDSFKTLLEEESDSAIVVYINNLYNQQDPAQKNGGYFIYDLNKSRFIKALVGQHDHPNKDILDEISQSFDEISEDDNVSSKVLTISKETAQEGSEYSWDFHIQWKDIDVIPNKPTDGKEYVLITNTEGQLVWTDKISNAIAFVKRDQVVVADSATVDFDIVLSYDNQGVMTDSILLFKNSLYIGGFTHDYDINANILTITLPNGEMFNTDDVLTLIVIRNTSAEMLTKLADGYVSKKEAIEILSSGTISLVDYVKREELIKYSLRNHIHTRYAAKDHSHWGVYADYYHNHDGLYMTRDDVNSLLGNILSINPDLIDIIASIASDAEALATFVTQIDYNEFVSTTNQRLTDLETVNDNTLYLDPNTGQVSKATISGESITFTPVNLNSYQILTKYKISDDPEETVVFNLEQWLDHVLDLIDSEELRIKKIYQQLMISDKIIKTYTLSSDSVSGLTLSNFVIKNVTLDITEAFDDEIGINMNGISFIDPAEIIEDEIAITSYDANLSITIEKNIRFDLGLSNVGNAILTISGYSI